MVASPGAIPPDPAFVTPPSTRARPARPTPAVRYANGGIGFRRYRHRDRRLDTRPAGGAFSPKLSVAVNLGCRTVVLMACSPHDRESSCEPDPQATGMTSRRFSAPNTRGSWRSVSPSPATARPAAISPPKRCRGPTAPGRGWRRRPVRMGPPGCHQPRHRSRPTTGARTSRPRPGRLADRRRVGHERPGQ